MFKYASCRVDHCSPHDTRLKETYIMKLTQDYINTKYGDQITCLSFDRDYETYHSNLEWKCVRYGHSFTLPVKKLTREIHCPTCRALRFDQYRREKTIECHQYSASKGGKFISNEYVCSKTILQWKCENDHEWGMNFRYLKMQGNTGHWCPVCRKGLRKDIKFSIFQRIVYVNVASELQNKGYTLKCISTALSISYVDLAYCRDKYTNTFPKAHLNLEELQILDESIKLHYDKALSVISKLDSPADREELNFKLAAALAAKEILADGNTSLVKIAKAFDVGMPAIYYWIHSLLPLYHNDKDILNHPNFIEKRDLLITKAKHLMFNRNSPLSDIDKLKKTLDFKCAIVSILVKYQENPKIKKADIIRCFNIGPRTLTVWWQSINMKRRHGEIPDSMFNNTLQKKIEEHILNFKSGHTQHCYLRPEVTAII